MTDEGRELVGMIQATTLEYHRNAIARTLWWALDWGMHRAVEHSYEMTEEEWKRMGRP